MRQQPQRTESRRPDDGLAVMGGKALAALSRHHRRMHGLHRLIVALPVYLALQANNGDVVIVEFHVYKDRVYVWLEDNLFLASINRAVLHNWLANPRPERPLTKDDVAFTFTDEAGIGLSFPDTDAALSPSSITQLIHRLKQ